MKKCKNITKIVATFYRKIGKKYVYEGHSSGRNGDIKWLCLDCEKFIDEPRKNEIRLVN